MVVPNIVIPFMKLRNLFRRKSKTHKRGSSSDLQKCDSCKLHRCPSPYPNVPQKCLHKCSQTKKEQKKTSRPSSLLCRVPTETENSDSGITLSSKQLGGKKKDRDGKRDGGMDWKMLPKYQYDAMKDEILKLKKEVAKKDEEIKKLNGEVSQNIANIMDKLESSGL